MRREKSSLSWRRGRKFSTRFELVSVDGPTHLANISCSQFSRIICIVMFYVCNFLCHDMAFWSDVCQCNSVHWEQFPRSLKAILLLIPPVRSLSVCAQSYAQCVVCVMLVRGIAKVEG